MKVRIKNLLIDICDWFLNLISILFTGRFRTTSIVITIGIIAMVASNLFMPWKIKNSYFDNTIPLFNILFSGLTDIFTAIEYGICQLFPTSPDLGVEFIALVLTFSVFFTKAITGYISYEKAPRPYIAKYIFELFFENIAFYCSTLISFLLLPMLENINSNMNEYGAVFVVGLIIITLAFSLPSLAYILVMVANLYIWFQLLCLFEPTWQKIATTFVALTINFLTEVAATQMMVKMFEHIILDHLPYRLQEKIRNYWHW